MNQEEAVALLPAKHEVCCALFPGFDRSKWTTGTPADRLSLLPPAQEHILRPETGKDHFVRTVP